MDNLWRRPLYLALVDHRPVLHSSRVSRYSEASGEARIAQTTKPQTGGASASAAFNEGIPEDVMFGKPIAIVLFSILYTTCTEQANKGREQLIVVPSVDLGRYAGQWYEIARLPNRFEKNCVSSVTATYTLRKDGKIDLVNRCKKASGIFETAKGKAKVVDKTSNAKLKVTFFWPFYGDYWILALGANYEYAVVGDESRKYLWILSRSPQLDDAVYQRLLANTSNQGFDTSRMIKTLQP